MRKLKIFFTGLALFILLGTTAKSRAMGLDNPSEPDDAIAEGMGGAVGDGRLFNATAYNPALLSNAPHLVEFNLDLNVSNDVFGTVNYLTGSNITNVQNSVTGLGNYIQDITNGLAQPTPAVGQINQGISGVQNALSNLQSAAATLSSRTIEAGAGLNVAVKFDDHWGFQVYNSTHAVVQVSPQVLLKAFEAIPTLPNLQGPATVQVEQAAATIWQDLAPVIQSAFPAQAVTLAQAVSTLQSTYTTDPNAVSKFNNTLSQVTSSIDQNTLERALLSDVADVTALAYTDTVAMVTYSFNPLEEETPLTLGANLKVVNRRIGYANNTWLSQQDLTNSSNITDPLKNDINQSTFRWGVDLGALYEFKDEKLSVEASAQDLLHSSATINTSPGDPLYGVTTDPAPTVVRMGASWHPIKQLIVNGDLDDLFSATSFYPGGDLASHAKLGAAFDLLGIIQLRGGYGDNNWNAGAGIPFLGLDYAYAVEDLTQAYNHTLQFKASF